MDALQASSILGHAVFVAKTGNKTGAIRLCQSILNAMPGFAEVLGSLAGKPCPAPAIKPIRKDTASAIKRLERAAKAFLLVDAGRSTTESPYLPGYFSYPEAIRQSAREDIVRAIEELG